MLTTILILLSVTFVSMLSPGPDMILLIKYSCAGSKKTALACVAGICASVSLHVSLAILGLAAIISTSVVLFNTIRYAGALYLIYIGLKSIRDTRHTALLKADGRVGSASVAFREGLFCNLLNPKFTIYLVSIFSQFIGADVTLIQRLIYGATIVLEGFVVWSIFVFLVRTNIIQSALAKFQVGINRLVGAVLISFGIAVTVKN